MACFQSSRASYIPAKFGLLHCISALVESEMVVDAQGMLPKGALCLYLEMPSIVELPSLRLQAGGLTRGLVSGLATR